jgi:hypothetical protein
MSPRITKVKRPDVDLSYGVNPQVWRAVAKRLLAAARLVWPPLAEALQGYADTREERTPAQARQFADQMEYFAGFFVLAGLAVENALKAHLLEGKIAAGEVIPAGTGVIRLFPDKAHDLVLLADWAKLTLTPGETRLLARLSEYVLWAGRYPIPKNAKNATFQRDTRDRDLKEIEAFIARL